MPLLFELLTEERDPAVRVVLGHFVLVYIHPYMDGNGRMGRFMMNVMLAAGGYPWTVIPVERRDDYMTALEAASVDEDIRPFAAFLGGIVTDNIEGKPGARVPGTPPRTINDGRSLLVSSQACSVVSEIAKTYILS